MDHAAAPQQQMISMIVGIVFVGIILFFRVRRMSRERPLKIEQLWIVPALYLAVAAYLFYAMPPKGIAWLWCAAALLLGGALGWQRGKTMHISVDPETQTLRQKASLASMFFLLGLIAVRTVARIEGQAWHFDVTMLTDILVALALGLLTMQRVEMYIRARRVLDEARPA